MLIVSLFVRCVCAVTCEQHDANVRVATIILILFIVLILWIAHLRIVCAFACVLCVCACLLACSILIASVTHADHRFACVSKDACWNNTWCFRVCNGHVELIIWTSCISTSYRVCLLYVFLLRSLVCIALCSCLSSHLLSEEVRRLMHHLDITYNNAYECARVWDTGTHK